MSSSFKTAVFVPCRDETLTIGKVVCGIVLDSVSRGRRETKRFAYLAA